MAITYKDNEQILIEIKKIMLETKTTQREIAYKLGIKPQGLTKMLNKKNFGFEDAQKILATMGYDLVIDFKRSNAALDTTDAVNDTMNVVSERTPESPQKRQEPAATMTREPIPADGPSARIQEAKDAEDLSGSSAHRYETLEEKLTRMREAHVSQKD